MPTRRSPAMYPLASPSVIVAGVVELSVFSESVSIQAAQLDHRRVVGDECRKQRGSRHLCLRQFQGEEQHNE